MIILFGLLGAALGSFGNVVVDRLPRMESLGGRSHCDGCGRMLGFFALIPVIGMLLQHARARCCNAPIGWHYTLFEVVSALLFIAALSVAPTALAAVLLAVCLFVLLCIARIDAATQMIPDVLSILLILFAGLLAWAQSVVPWESTLLLLAFFGGQWLLSRGRWIGTGDILLSVGLGVLVQTVAHALLLLFFAYVAGAAYAVVLLAQKKTDMEQQIAFGPFLCVAAMVTMLRGSEILAFVGL